jgi:hypothetical protein
MIFTWKLWRTLREPPLISHALYRRVVTTPALPVQVQFDGRWLWVLGLLGLGYLITQHGLISLMLVVFIVPAGGVLLFLMMPVLLPPFTAFVGGFWAASISSSLVREHHTHTYELLCMAPGGTLGANWAIASGCMHRGDVFGALRYGMYVAMMIGGMFLGLLILVAVFMALRESPGETLIVAGRTVVDLAVILGLFYAHYIQSVVLSALIGVCAPALFHQRGDTPWFAFGMFTAIQLGTYAAFALAHALLQPILNHIPPDNWAAYVGAPVIYLLLFVLLREAIILGLWEFVSARLSNSLRERDVLMQSVS